MRRLCIIFLLLSFVPVSFGQLEGSLSGTRGPGTLSVDDTIYIDAGDTLILVHGTTLDFRGPFPFYINGTILAKGTDPEPVIFTTDTID
ncbi:hypothetical protein KKB28_04635, partial [bacterium]|nr:hypothetical protein [bacterium]